MIDKIVFITQQLLYLFYLDLVTDRKDFIKIIHTSSYVRKILNLQYAKTDAT